MCVYKNDIQDDSTAKDGSQHKNSNKENLFFALFLTGFQFKIRAESQALQLIFRMHQKEQDVSAGGRCLPGVAVLQIGSGRRKKRKQEKENRFFK